jgi:hypothetical protein
MNFREHPLRNCLEIPDSAYSGTFMSRQKEQKWPALLPRVGEKYSLDPTLAIFQTVSPGTWANKGKKKGRNPEG